MKILSEMMFADFAGESPLEAIKWWLTYMVLCAFGIFCGKSLTVVLFSRVGQNIVSNVRQELYENVLRKEIGWHDDRKNSAGVMTATLASDV